MRKSDILLNSIDTFYGASENGEMLAQILSKSGGISLRNLEWLSRTILKRQI